uniref:Secreted protein n=1 Tax=Rhipicephalus appendiculatus TaxID=34631 RepID=A0A131YZ43_RHIAP
MGRRRLLALRGLAWSMWKTCYSSPGNWCGVAACWARTCLCLTSTSGTGHRCHAPSGPTPSNCAHLSAFSHLRNQLQDVATMPSWMYGCCNLQSKGFTLRTPWSSRHTFPRPWNSHVCA